MSAYMRLSEVKQILKAPLGANNSQRVNSKKLIFFQFFDFSIEEMRLTIR